MKRFALLLLLALGATVAVACGPGASGQDGPPEIRLGADVCEQCHMIISDERFASAYRTVHGIERRFDDIGDMALYHSIHAEDVEAFWVHDMETLEWLEVPKAWFVTSSEIMSPMGHGLAAYGSETRANAAAEEVGGAVVRWNEVLADAVTVH